MIMNKSKRIFLAGHNGLVGNAVLNKLRKEGFKNIITRNKKNLDLLNQKKVDIFFKESKIHAVIFCAGFVGGIGATSVMPVEFSTLNLRMFLNTIEASFNNKVDVFINLGSACIYPTSIRGDLKEEDLLTDKLEPTNEAYSIAKISSLKICNFYKKQHNKNYFSLMPANIFGENDNYNLKTSHVVPALIRKFFEAKKNNSKNLIIWGDGKPIRDLFYSHDLADAILFCLKNYKKQIFLKYVNKNGFLNVGTGNGVQIKEIVSLLKNISGFKGKIIYDSRSSINGMKRRVVNISKIKKLGWKPNHNFEQALKKVYEFYSNNYAKLKH